MAPMVTFSFHGDNGSYYGKQHIEHYTKRAKSDERYSFYQTFVEYGGVKQKWVLLLSHKMKEKKEQTLRMKLDKEVEKADKAFKKLKGEDFFCEEDALKREINKKTYNGMDIFQFPGNYGTYFSERRRNEV